MQPKGDVGVLFVHGIGDHKEGDTLTSFGEPLLDWLRDWLHGKSSTPGTDAPLLQAARLRATRTEAESPAYALVTIAAPAADPPSEQWIFSEAWWGDSIQPPVALKLLKWLWSRGPLLIFWHFYLRTDVTRGRAKDPTREDVVRVAVAFMLAASTQLAVVVALILWLIPIGRWRQGVVDVVRAATLTLGDSYALLEHDIQRTALVDRVRRSLEWLAPRCKTVVVVAHSQGCAIAHEALKGADTTKVLTFVTIGSGLEKLNFLRKVRELRDGLAEAQLLVPVVLTGVAMILFGLSDIGQRWHVGVGGVILFVGILILAFLMNAMTDYHAALANNSEQLSRPDGSDIAWTDISAANDLVPMGDGSLLRKQRFVTQISTANEHSYLHDHVGYFQNHNLFIPRIWQALSQASTLPLFTADDAGRVSRFARLHEWHAHVLAWSRRVAVLAAVVSLVAFRNDLVAFGRSIIKSVEGSPVNDLMKPFRAVAALLAWIVQLLWAPETAVSDLLSQAIVGGLVLIGAVVLWWLAFKPVWRSVAIARGRALCRGADVLQNPRKIYRARATCAAMQTVGAVPLLVVLILLFAPQILSLNAIGQALAAAIALVFVGGALFLALAGPFGWRGAIEGTAGGDDSDVELTWAVFYPIALAFLFLVVFFAGAALWPYGGRERLEAVLSFALAAHGLAWQVYAADYRRSTFSRGWWISVLAVPPAAVVATMIAGVSSPAVYIIPYTVASLIWTPIALLSTVPQRLRKVIPALNRFAREHVQKFWPK